MYKGREAEEHFSKKATTRLLPLTVTLRADYLKQRLIENKNFP